MSNASTALTAPTALRPVDANPRPSGAWVQQPELLPSGFLPERIVHLHPTRRCNLACAHCYSASSPEHDQGIDPSAWRALMPRLRAEGYTQVSVSGGEPLLYPGLGELVDAAQGEGLRVTLVSNGLLAGPRQDALLDRLNGLAISFDGLAERHDALRQRRGAFARASAALARQAARGRPVGAAVAVTQPSLAELPELVEHLAGLGAQAVQIRPVAAAGRGADLGDALPLRESDRLRLYLVVLALQQELSSTGLHVHGDLAPARRLWQQREAYASLLAQCQRPGDERARLSDLVNPLVITETGQLKPVAYDLHASLHIGHWQRLQDAVWMRRYAQHGVSALQRLVGQALVALEQHPGVVDWFDTLARASHQQPLALRRVA